MSTKPRGFFARMWGKLFDPVEPGYELADEDIDTYGATVTVVDEVSPEHDRGRIELRGTTWKATSISHTIPAGAEARIVYRENLVWFVEQITPGDFDNLEDPADS